MIPRPTGCAPAPSATLGFIKEHPLRKENRSMKRTIMSLACLTAIWVTGVAPSFGQDDKPSA